MCQHGRHIAACIYHKSPQTSVWLVVIVRACMFVRVFWGAIFLPLCSAADLKPGKYMSSPPALMCVEWLTAVKKNRNCTASERSRQSDDPPRTPHTRGDNYSGMAREPQPPPSSPCGASVIQPG